ncbi:conserved hypothetical protein [Methylobacterium sp. 4-46]|uniref:hypothetical protein n=1 Tax=unclassified Methylobacterium TaxID=2615210 RepID=UPI000152D315|nr:MULTISPECIES: hypothetical protein [Methylobacterium]ACA20968.1 conserved hypothetical protein [Methylobacterium sp. 4-46]WFT80123.1 hypothetical protein QA634_33930 [Methylobacterium nodulans]
MSESDTLAQALADVSQRRAALEAEYERIGSELAKLRLAENALRAIVDDTDLPLAGLAGTAGLPLAGAGRPAEAARTVGRGSRGPRANSAKGRLKALLEGAGPQGLTSAQIARQLPDVAPGTLNTYLSVMVAGGEAVRAGEFYRGVRPAEAALSDEPDEAAPDGEAGADLAG